MTIAVFDPLKLAKRLEATGVSSPHAAGFAEALSEVMTTELATKSDLTELRGWASAELADIRGEMRAELADIRGEMRRELADVRREMRTGFVEVRAAFAEVRTEFAKVRTEMVASRAESNRWMVGLFIAQTSVTVGVLLRLTG